MKHLLVNGHDMAYIELGAGPPLVCVHGSLNDFRFWSPVLGPLSRQHRLIVPSLRRYFPEVWDGKGGGFTIQQHVADMITFVEALEVGPVHLMGHSRGGHIAFRVAETRPDLVLKLILAEPGGELDASLAPPGMPGGSARVLSVIEAAEKIVAGDVDGGLELFVDRIDGRGSWAIRPPGAKQLRRDNALTLIGQINEQRAPFTRKAAESIGMPTLLIGGTATKGLLPVVLQALANAIPGARCEMIADASHAMLDQAPARFSEIVLDFTRPTKPPMVTSDARMPSLQVRRLAGNPIIRPNMDGRMESNINGPSLIKVPDWVARPLGRYYLYFAHHDGRYIRMAYADRLEGPWRTHEPGVLPLAASRYAGHVASPDVHVDDGARRIRMYFHGSEVPSGVPDAEQHTRVAISTDGLHFEALPEILGKSYFRAFDWRGATYALAMPGIFYRSRDGLTNFERGPTLFSPRMRHCALMRDDNQLSVFYTDVGDAPERILRATIDISGDWLDWKESPPVTVLEPELDYEGARQPLAPSVRGLVHGPVRQLRDPAIFREHGTTYLLYAVAGESGIAIAELG